MSNIDKYVKSVRFTEETNEKFTGLALRLGRDKRVVFRQMAEYFHRTKKDPADINDEILKNTLIKNHDTYIRFIRAQEENILIPVKTEIDRMIQSQIKILNCFNKQILEANTDLAAGQQAQAKKFSETDQLLKTIAEKLDSKEALKLKFTYILNNYIKAREGFSFTTSAKEKEELVLAARQQIARL